MLEKLALPTIKEELPRLHASHAQMLPEEAETEYLKVSTHLQMLLLKHFFSILPFNINTDDFKLKKVCILQIAQQLPEYGVMFHRVGREKRPVVGELVLGVCAKGVIVYEIKNQIRTVTRRFLWRETDSISTGVKRSPIFLVVHLRVCSECMVTGVCFLFSDVN